MATIRLICPKCGKKLHVEDESRYYNRTYGCTIHCSTCDLTLIGVDLSVCHTCSADRKKQFKCKDKLVTMVEFT
jgi:hypothetical protein